MGRLRRAAVAATACTTTAFHVTTTPQQALNQTAPLRAKGSGYVEKDEDSTLDRFQGPGPDQYVPDETYEGTCVPGTARDNAPLEDLSLVARLSVKMDLNLTWSPRRRRESPCHTGEHRAARVLRGALPRAPPANHPAMLSPWERVWKRPGSSSTTTRTKSEQTSEEEAQKKTTKVEAVDDIEVPVKEEKDPLFADDASDLLDAALGLDDDEDEAPSPPSEEAPAPEAAAGHGRPLDCVWAFVLLLRRRSSRARRRAAVCGAAGGDSGLSCAFLTFRDNASQSLLDGLGPLKTYGEVYAKPRL